MTNKKKYNDEMMFIRHQISLKIVHKLDEIAFKKEISRTELINQIIKKYIKE